MKIARLIVGNSEKNSDLLYKVGVFVPDDFIYFEVDQLQGVIVSALEFDRVHANAKKDVRVFQNEFFGAGNNITDIILALARCEKIEEFEVPGDFPLFLADVLRENSLKVTAVKGRFFPEREFKNAWELSQVKEAMRITELGMKKAYQVLAESKIGNDGFVYWQNELLTSEILRSEIDITLLRNGAMPDHTIVASYLQAAQPHNEGQGGIYANKPIVIDIFPRLQTSGYFGDLTRTYVKGQADEIVKKAFNAVVEARDTAKSVICSNIPCEQPYLLVKNILEKHNFMTGIDNSGRNYGFFHGLGHGVGLDIHESPRLSRKIPAILRGGEIVTVEPGLYYPDWGGVRMEDIVYVREKDCEVITQIGDEFEIS